MTNSQKEFDAYFHSAETPCFDNDQLAALHAWQACNSMWERKLDEGVLAEIVARGMAKSTLRGTKAELIVQEIIGHMKGE